MRKPEILGTYSSTDGLSRHISARQAVCDVCSIIISRGDSLRRLIAIHARRLHVLYTHAVTRRIRTIIRRNDDDDGHHHRRQNRVVYVCFLPVSKYLTYIFKKKNLNIKSSELNYFKTRTRISLFYVSLSFSSYRIIHNLSSRLE